MIDFLGEARRLGDVIVGLRKEIHRWPELGNREFETAARIEAALDGWGIPHRRLLDTAVVARLEGSRPGPVVALRADMDALPLNEATGADFASRRPGVMHACGHDVHMAAALGAAKLLSDHRDALPGTVVFLFQPDEENDGGARRLIEAGALEGVSAVFGAHVSPDVPSGCVGVRYGKFYAASDTFKVIVKGRSAHGAMRERGVDALLAASEMVGEAVRLPGRLPGERCVVSVGTFASGAAQNIVADRAEFTGIMRTLGPAARAEIREHFQRMVADVAAKHGAEAECLLKASYPGIVNDDGMTALAEAAIRDLLGEERVQVIAESTMTTEDFGEYLLERPGTFYHIGAGCPLPLHNTAFLPEESAPVTAAAVHAAVVWRAMERGEGSRVWSVEGGVWSYGVPLPRSDKSGE